MLIYGILLLKNCLLSTNIAFIIIYSILLHLNHNLLTLPLSNFFFSKCCMLTIFYLLFCISFKTFFPTFHKKTFGCIKREFTRKDNWDVGLTQLPNCLKKLSALLVFGKTKQKRKPFDYFGIRKKLKHSKRYTVGHHRCEAPCSCFYNWTSIRLFRCNNY